MWHPSSARVGRANYEDTSTNLIIVPVHVHVTREKSRGSTREKIANNAYIP